MSKQPLPPGYVEEALKPFDEQMKRLDALMEKPESELTKLEWLVRFTNKRRRLSAAFELFRNQMETELLQAEIEKLRYQVEKAKGVLEVVSSIPIEPETTEAERITMSLRVSTIWNAKKWIQTYRHWKESE